MSKKTIKDLTLLNATSGNEGVVFDYLKENMKNASEITNDNIGSFIAKYEGKKPGINIAVVAHMDEIGFMVKNITEDGFIKVTNIGGITPNVCLAKQVTLTNRYSDTFTGVIVVKAPHSKDKSELTIDQLVVDFGFESKEEVLNSSINVGDMITFNTDFSELPNNKLLSKAFDNRLGCSIICELDEKFKNIETGNVYLCASVQEEVGLRGAQTLIHKISDNIDYIMVVDVSPVEDAFGEKDVQIGKGCLLRVNDPRTILDYKELQVIRDLANENNINLQDYFSRGGTDANQLQVQKSGHITSAICVGGRNLHSANSVISYDDYCGARDLIYAYVQKKLKG